MERQKPRHLLRPAVPDGFAQLPNPRIDIIVPTSVAMEKLAREAGQAPFSPDEVAEFRRNLAAENKKP